MATSNDPRFIVRVGDDGQAKSRHETLDAARDAARELSLTGWSGQGQILDRETGDRETWRDGECRGGNIR